MEQVKSNNRLLINIILILVVILLAVFPIILLHNAEFAGADSQAEELIGEINDEYVPWFSPIFEPPSGEIESMLFSLQAAIGAGIIGYGLGYMRKQKEQ